MNNRLLAYKAENYILNKISHHMNQFVIISFYYSIKFKIYYHRNFEKRLKCLKIKTYFILFVIKPKLIEKL